MFKAEISPRTLLFFAEKRMNNSKIAIIGCGNLGLSLVSGFLKSKYEAQNIAVSKRNIETISFLKEKGVQVFASNKEAIQDAKFILIAVKPYDVLAILEDIKDTIDIENQIVISLATGIKISEIEQILGNASVFRAMPNTAAAISESMTCISSNSESEKFRNEIEDLFSYLGKTIFISENLMESATVLGACGLAFVLRFMRSMVQGGVQIGFDVKTATQIVNQVVKASAELLIEGKNHPEFEIDKVTTPKGCTIIGLNEMEHNGFSSALIKGITSSYKQIES